jgi:fermentation-respiration switch protein FrsA (DUF1100 family)
MVLPVYLTAGGTAGTYALAFLGEMLGGVYFIHNPGFTFANGDEFVKDDVTYVMVVCGSVPLLIPKV